MIRPRPTIKFLVESDGADTFWMARRQLLFSLPDWPMSLQVAGSQSHTFSARKRGDGIGQKRRRRDGFRFQLADSTRGGSTGRCARTVGGGRRASRRAFAQFASVVIGIAVITSYVQFRQDDTVSRQSPLPVPAEALPDQPVVDEPDSSTAAAAPRWRRSRSSRCKFRRRRLSSIRRRWRRRRRHSTRPAAIAPRGRPGRRSAPPQPAPTGQAALDAARHASWASWFAIRRPGSPRPRRAAAFCGASATRSRRSDKSAATAAPQIDLDLEQEPRRQAGRQRRIPLRAAPQPNRFHRPRAAPDADQGRRPGPHSDDRPCAVDQRQSRPGRRVLARVRAAAVGTR